MAAQEYIHYGSITDAVIDLLSSSTEMQALSITKITRNLVGYDKTNKWIVVSRQGGSWAWPQPAHPRIDIECYAPLGGDAEDMIETALSVMFKNQFNYVGHGVRLISCKVETSPFESTDKLTSVCRFLAALRITVKPA